jgi:hypothetical protein
MLHLYVVDAVFFTVTTVDNNNNDDDGDVCSCY